jgi:hypothetical protein
MPPKKSMLNPIWAVLYIAGLASFFYGVIEHLTSALPSVGVPYYGLVTMGLLLLWCAEKVREKWVPPQSN